MGTKEDKTETTATADAFTRLLSAVTAVRQLSDADMKQLGLLEQGDVARKELNAALNEVDKTLALIKQRCSNPTRNLAHDMAEVMHAVDGARTKLNRLQFWKRG